MSEFDLSFNKYKNSILLNRLQYPFATASVSIHNYEYLYLIHFYSENDYYDIGLPVLKQTFSEYKSFFRELKSNITPTEFIFCLNEIRNRIDEVIEKIYKSNISEEYFNKYDFDYVIYKKK